MFCERFYTCTDADAFLVELDLLDAAAAPDVSPIVAQWVVATSRSHP